MKAPVVVEETQLSKSLPAHFYALPHQPSLTLESLCEHKAEGIVGKVRHC